MRVSHETVTTALGPGRRYVIWVQGCDKRCAGCINPAGWDKSSGALRSEEDLLGSIIGNTGLTGVTISGGEPFLQFDELSKLVDMIKEKTDLDIMLFTGYRIEELERKFGAAFSEFKRKIDILIDGEYIEEQNTGSMYRGSDNQRIFFFTEKYRPFSERILSSKKRDFSFQVINNGDIYFIGIPPVGFYEEFLRNLGGQTQ